MLITSKENSEIKKIKKLYDKKFREEEGCFIIDGIKIFEEAIEENANIIKIIFCKEILEKNERLFEKKLWKIIEQNDALEVSNNVLKSISEVQNPQGIIAVIKKNNNQTINFNEKLFLALDGIQDPGNIGTIIRTADSSGITQIICSKDTVDCFNPKVVRSTMGAIFRVNVIYVDDLKKCINEFKEHNIKVLATDLSAKKSIYEESLENSLIIIGNEASGVSKEIIDISSGKIKIPMWGKAESLNAAIATGIIVYEAKRQIEYK